MKNKIIFSILVFILFISLSSAYYGYNDQYEDYKKTTTTEEKISQRKMDYWGEEKITTSKKEKVTVERKNYPSRHYRDKIYYRQVPVYYNYETYSNDYIPSSNFRYKKPYSRNNYNEAYGKPYYYESIYDQNLGYYNWRY
ncbi:MAG: hypothetical protein AABW65_00970 [Nanoarchaeota archaeon]